VAGDNSSLEFLLFLILIPVLNVVKRMLIEMLLLISLTGLWDIFPK
jgi:hypothetical protein